MKVEFEERLRIGAKELFYKFGIKSITMDDIAKHMGVSKKTIYRVVSNKKEIVEMMMRFDMEEHKIAIQKIADEAPDVIAEIINCRKFMNDVFSEMNPILFYDMQKYHPKAWQIFRDFKENFISTIVEQSLIKGIKQGLVRPEINTKIVVRMRLAEVEMAFDPEVFPPSKYDVVEVHMTFINMFLHGICTLKGHNLVNKYKDIIE
jgi:AcrR family transcriptional regulator